MYLLKNQSAQVLHYDNYGSHYIKKHKVSPDAWAQLVKQLAFHKMHDRPGVCYESCQTRRFQFGRTEVIRSASNESKEWAEAMLDPKASVSSVLMSPVSRPTPARGAQSRVELCQPCPRRRGPRSHLCI